MYKNLKVASKVPGKGRSLLRKGKQATVFQKDRGEHETRGLSGKGREKEKIWGGTTCTKGLWKALWKSPANENS